MAKKNSAYIGNLTVRSNSQYIVYGSVRGLISEHRSVDAAHKSCKRDHGTCSRYSAGSYSDAGVYEFTNGEWNPVYEDSED